MRPTLIDRLFVVWIAATLTLWLAALTVLWGVTSDFSGASQIRTFAAAMLAIWATAGLPGRVVGGMQRLLAARKPRGALAAALATAGSASASRQEVRMMLRLLAVAVIVAAAGGLASTGAVYLGAAAAEAIGQWRFRWGPTSWTGIKLALQFVGMVPAGLGVSLAFLSTARLRAGSGRDVYASVVREWLIGLAAGLAVLAVTWWAGANLLGVALVACVALLAAAGGLFQRARLTVRPRRRMQPIASARQRGQRAAIAVGAGAVTVALLVQMRLLRDVAGAGLAGRACWAAASLALLVAYLRKVDKRSRPPSVTQQAGATIGAAAGLVVQCSLLMRCLLGGSVAGACGVLAVAGQVPLAALTGAIVSAQRRRFATGGGRARAYVSAGAGGAGLGALLYLAAGSSSIGSSMAVAGAIAVVVAAVMRGISSARRADRRLQWAGLGAALICAAGAAPVACLHGLESVSAGVWLTTVSRRLAGRPDVAVTGCLPRPVRWRSAAVDRAQAELLAGRPGRWWVVAADARDAKAPLAGGSSAARAHPDPTAPAAAGVIGQAPHSEADFLHAVQRDPRRFDGVLLAAMPADHPEAWRCYHPAVLRSCAAKVHSGGLMVLRTQASGGGVELALEVARTFARVARGGWAVLALDGGRVDLLLAGAGGACRRPRRREGTYVVALDRLVPETAPVPGTRLGGRGVLFGRRTSPEELRERLGAPRAGEP